MLVLCGYLAGYNVGKVSAVLPVIRDDLELSLFLAGTVASSYSVAAMILAIAIGMFVSRIGALASVFAGLILTGLAGAIGASANAYLQLILGRLAEGVGYILLAISILVLIAKITNEKSRPMAMGIWGTFIPGGVALSMLVALVMQNSWTNQWRPLWWFTCVLASVCLVLLVVFVLPALKATHCSSSSATAVDHKPALHASVFERDPLLLAASFMLYSMFFVSLVTYLPTVLTETSDMQVKTATRLSAFVALFNILGNLLGGWFIGRKVRLKLVLIAALIGASLFSSVVFLDEFHISIRVGCGLFACLFGGMLPASVFASVATFVPPKKAGLLLGVVLQALGTGQVIGPIAMAALVEHMGSWRWGAVYFVFLAIVSAVVLRRFQVRNQKFD